MKIAVFGSVHGRLDQIYEDVEDVQRAQGFLVDLIIICGNLHAARGQNDLKCMNSPEKSAVLGDFPDYFMRRKHANLLTLVIGGTQDAWNHFQALPYGGWIAPNIYYLGYSNVIKFNGVRIAGISGIYDLNSLNKGRYEILPYNKQMIKSVYHIRYLESFRILQVKEKIDVMITHDWPKPFYNMVQSKEFLNNKSQKNLLPLEKDIENKRLGNPLHEILLNQIKPKHWLSSHLSLFFQTCYKHDQNSSTKCTSIRPNIEQEETCFISLDRIGANRKYFEIVSVKSDEFDFSGLEYDPEWLAILRLTNNYVTTQEYPSKKPPSPDINPNYDLSKEIQIVNRLFSDSFKVPNNFTISLPYNLLGQDVDPDRTGIFVNEQTVRFCKLLDLCDPMQRILDRVQGKIVNPDRIDIDDIEEPDWIDEAEYQVAIRNEMQIAVTNYDVNMDYEDAETLAIEPPPISDFPNQLQISNMDDYQKNANLNQLITPAFQAIIKREKDDFDSILPINYTEQTYEGSQESSNKNVETGMQLQVANTESFKMLSDVKQNSQSVDESNQKKIDESPFYYFIDTRGTN